MVAHQDTNACHDNDRHVKGQYSSLQLITPWLEINLTFTQLVSIKILARGL
jgi:hypothetical protein